jgi:hypothetical protein
MIPARDARARPQRFRRSPSPAAALGWLTVYLGCLLLPAGCNRGRSTPTPAHDRNGTAAEASPPSPASAGGKAGSAEPEEAASAVAAADATTAPRNSQTVPGASLEFDRPEQGRAGGLITDQPPADVEATWNRQRIVLLAPGGPLAVDLAVGVGGWDLDQAFERAVDAQAAALGFPIDAPKPRWEEFLAHPGIRSGWLGNPVPTPELTSQILERFDLSQDGLVDRQELLAFITGAGNLSMTSASSLSPESSMPAGASLPATSSAPRASGRVRIQRERAPTAAASVDSTWGPADSNQDGQLDAEELAGLSEQIRHWDVDGDNLVTRAEVQSLLLRDNGPAMGRSMLTQTPLVVLADPLSLQQRRAILSQYLFGATAAREDFPAWSDSRWDAADVNRDGQLDGKEFEAALKGAADIALHAGYPALTTVTGSDSASRETHSRWTLTAQLMETATTLRHASPAEGMQVRTGRMVLVVRVEDDLDERAHDAFLKAYAQAQRDPEGRVRFANQLGLSADALDLWQAAHRTSDTATSDTARAAEAAWRAWSVDRGAQCTVLWRIPELPWFDALDLNGDGRLTAAELRGWEQLVREFDADGDSRLNGNELPLVIHLVIARVEPRLRTLRESRSQEEEGFLPKGLISEWFLHMDTNQDKAISKQEFLGTNTSFEALDRNKDGIIALEEVYETP